MYIYTYVYIYTYSVSAGGEGVDWNIHDFRISESVLVPFAEFYAWVEPAEICWSHNPLCSCWICVAVGFGETIEKTLCGSGTKRLCIRNPDVVDHFNPEDFWHGSRVLLRSRHTILVLQKVTQQHSGYMSTVWVTFWSTSIVCLLLSNTLDTCQQSSIISIQISCVSGLRRLSFRLFRQSQQLYNHVQKMSNVTDSGIGCDTFSFFLQIVLPIVSANSNNYTINCKIVWQIQTWSVTLYTWGGYD